MLPSQAVLLDILNIGSPYTFSFEDAALWLNQPLLYGEVMLIQKAVMVPINLMVGITSRSLAHWRYRQTAAVSSQGPGASSCWPRSPLPAEPYKDILLNEEEIFFSELCWESPGAYNPVGFLPYHFPNCSEPRNASLHTAIPRLLYVLALLHLNYLALLPTRLLFSSPRHHSLYRESTVLRR